MTLTTFQAVEILPFTIRVKNVNPWNINRNSQQQLNMAYTQQTTCAKFGLDKYKVGM